MSTAFKNNRKARKKRLDLEDPERRQVRNLIRRGKAPRLTMAQDPKGGLLQRGTYRRYSKEWLDATPEQRKKMQASGHRMAKGKRAYVLRLNNFIRFTHGAIFSNKAAKNA